MAALSTIEPVYVIVLNWNLPADTIACIDSLLQSATAWGGRLAIVVVDNGSTDDSVAQFRQTFAQRIELLVVGQNLGFAGGMNVGMRHALERGAGAVILLNNDTIVDPALLTALAAAAEQLPQAGILGPAIYYHAAPDTIWQLGDNEHPWLPVPLRLPPTPQTLAAGAPLRVDYLTGCCLFIRRRVLEEVGLLDERYFMYFEEADFCRRTRNAGFEIWLTPAARLWHKVAISAQKDRPGQRYWRTWGKVQFFIQNRHGRLPGLIHLYLVGKAVQSTVADLARRNWQLIGPLWAGLLDGYSGTTARRQKYFRR